MKKRTVLSTGLVLGVTVALVCSIPASRHGVMGLVKRERFERGHPFSYWVQALKDSDDGLREEAAAVLAEMGADARDAVPELCEALKDSDPQVRVSAAFALLNIGPKSKSVVPALSAALKDDIALVRMYAVLSPKKIGPDALEAVPALIAAIQDKKNETPPPRFLISVRQAAVETLGRIGPKAHEAIPVLTETLKATDDAYLIDGLHEALELIGPAPAPR
jgi:hypothetical protein